MNITIEDVNDNSPVFSAATVELIVKEDVKTDLAIYQVHATDPDDGDNGQIRYSLLTNPDGVFSLDASSGLVKLNKQLNYETKTQYTLSVEARDLGSTQQKSTMNLRIRVEDVNDNAPVFTQTSYSVAVAEATPVNNKFAQVSATDADTGNNAKIMYAMDANPTFGIFPNDGWLYVKRALDREDKQTYTFTVTARDNGTPQRTVRVPLTIKVSLNYLLLYLLIIYLLYILIHLLE